VLITDLSNYLETLGEPKFRLKQIQEAIYKQFKKDFSDITNLSLPLRQNLSLKFPSITGLTHLHTLTGKQAEKVLFKTAEGNLIESVKLTYNPNKERSETHTSLCISTQSGCAMKCQFCATGAIGFKQNLSADEIVGQYLFFKQKGDNIDSIIFMGMGEPFANIPNVFESLKIFTSKDIIGLSPQRLSISTVGVIPGIEKLTAEYPQTNLTFSLHSPFDDERSTIMPINKAYPILKVFDALDKYIQTTKNRVFIAYTLLDGVNDSEKHAEELVKIIKSRAHTSYLYHVNLIRYNPCPSETQYEKSKPENIKAFQDVLEKNNISNTLRQDFGTDIDAACGQLYATYKNLTSTNTPS